MRIYTEQPLIMKWLTEIFDREKQMQERIDRIAEAKKQEEESKEPYDRSCENLTEMIAQIRKQSNER